MLPAVTDGGIVVSVRGYQGDGSDRIRVAPVFVADYTETTGKLQHLFTLAAEQKLTVRVAKTLCWRALHLEIPIQ